MVDEPDINKARAVARLLAGGGKVGAIENIVFKFWEKFAKILKIFNKFTINLKNIQNKF